jgi:hypothetical protein
MKERNEDKIREKLLADCRRPAFARLARYTKEVDEYTGETVTRPSVKFVEAALARWGNVATNNVILKDTDSVRNVLVTTTDTETGLAYSREITIEKTVERSRPAKHEKVLGARSTAIGQTFIVPATEDDLAAKEAVLTSIVVRQLGLRILPADLVDECMIQVALTMAVQVALAMAEEDPFQGKPSSSHPAPTVLQEKPATSRSSALAASLKKRKADTKTTERKPVSERQGKKRRPRK